jgi:hypothetical protein
MLTLLLASFPRLISLFFLFRRPPLLCLSLVLFLLFLRVGFKFNLVLFWGYLNIVSHAFICFIRTLEPFRTRLNKLFSYPLTNFFKTQQTNLHGSFPSYCLIGVCVILKKVVLVIEKLFFKDVIIIEKFFLTSRGLWRTIDLFFKRNIHMPYVPLVLTTHGKKFRSFVFVDV